MNTTGIRLVVRDWGPIREGSVEVKPLTIFVGPNNTGKSYLAMLLYALTLAFNKSSYEVGKIVLENEALEDELFKVVDPYLKGEITADDFAERLSHVFSDILTQEFAESLPRLLAEELERVYSSKIEELVRLGAAKACVGLEVDNPRAGLSMLFTVTRDGELKIEKFKLYIKPALIENILPSPSLLDRVKLLEKSRAVARSELASLLGSIALRLMFEGTLSKELFGSGVHYLPASRAGILHSYGSVAKALISLASLAPIRGVEVPGMPGVLADFLGELILMSTGSRRREVAIESVAKSLEEEILEGEVALSRRLPGAPPTLVFRFSGGELPVARVSSMIAEAAPLAILLKYGSVKPGDTLILEEPEAHLHPDKQARLAELLARLVNEAGMRLLITTHSDILLARLSNLVSLSAIPSQEAEKLGYRPSTALSPEKVSVYSFEPGPGGVTVAPIEVTHEGIPDDVFLKILENLYEETLNLYYRLQEVRGSAR